MKASKSPIDSYLDKLGKDLPSHAYAADGGWRLIVEARDHLLEKADMYESRGFSRETAETQAVKDFGSARNIVAGSIMSLAGSGDMSKELIRGSWLVASILFIAVGLSGLLANLFVAVWGQTFLAGDAPGVTYTAWRCAEYMRLVPDAPNCTVAAITHHYGEIVDSRVALGVIGLIGLFTWYVAIRKLTSSRLPGVVWLAVLLAPSAMLAIAGLFLGGLPVLIGDIASGAGNMLSIGVVFGVMSLILAVLFWQQSRQFGAPTSTQ